MKINAQEILLLNKNMKFGSKLGEEPATDSQNQTQATFKAEPSAPITNPVEVASKQFLNTEPNAPTEQQAPAFKAEPTAPVVEQTETKPVTGLNALDVQGKNNIAFQGVTMPNTLKRGLSKMMFVLALGGSMAATNALTSCGEYNQEVSVVVDMKAFAEAMASLRTELAAIREQLEISNQLQTEIRDIETENQTYLKALYENSKLTLDQVKSLSSTVSYGIYSITEELKENGATEKEILATLKDVRSQVNVIMTQLDAGVITFDEAMKQITDILGSIDNTLKSILEQVTGIRDDMNANHEEYMEAKEKELKYLSGIYKNGKINNYQLYNLNAGVDSLNAKISNLEANSNELLEIAKDSTKYNELMAKLDELNFNEIDYQKFEQMFKLLNMNLQNALRQYNEDNKKGQQALINAINSFKATYINMEIHQSKQLDNISRKLTFIANYLPNMNQDDIKAAIEELTNALNNNTGAIEENTEIIGEGLDSVNAKLDALLQKMDVVIGKLSGFERYYADQNEKWNAVLKQLGNVNNSLVNIKKEQQFTNTLLMSFKDDFASLKKAANTANTYLSILVQKQDELEEALKNINMDGGMTRDEFLSAMKERDEERDTKLAADFEKFIQDYGFDKVPGDVQTIKDLISEIKDAVQNQKDYSGQLDTIINYENDIYTFLKNMDFSDPNCVAKLDKIINILENFKCNCECGKGSDKNDESIKDIEDMFS